MREPAAVPAVARLLALGRVAGRARRLHPGVLPRLVRVRLDVLLEPAPVLEDVVDDPAEEGDVTAGADADELRRHRARAREAGIDVDHLGAALPGLEHPLEP